MLPEVKRLISSRYQDEQKEKDLLDQIFTNLTICVEDIKRKNPEVDLSHVQKCLDNQTWKSVDYVKQQLVEYYSEELLDLELEKAISKAKSYKLTKRGVPLDINIKTAPIEKKRMALLNIIQELQWSFEVFRQSRAYISLIGVRVSIAFITLFFLFFLPNAFPKIAAFLNIATGEHSEFLYTAIITGMLGATFSKLITLQKTYGSMQLNELRFAYKTSAILFRIFIGAGAGLVLFYLLQGHLLGGELFPAFPDVDPIGKPYLDNKSNALLIVFSFIAGLSENFIPSILSKVEGGK
jgi:hypothetical protein